MRKGMFAAAALAMLMVASVAKAGDPASPITAERQAAFAKTLPMNDRQDFAFADRGFLGTRADPIITRADGQPAWNLAAYDFLREPDLLGRRVRFDILTGRRDRPACQAVLSVGIWETEFDRRAREVD